MKFKINSKHQKINSKFFKKVFISTPHNKESNKYILSGLFSSFYFKDKYEYIGIYSIKRKTLACSIYKIIKNTDSYCIAENHPNISKEYITEPMNVKDVFTKNPVKDVPNHGQICFLPNLTIEKLRISKTKTCYIFTNMAKREGKNEKFVMDYLS